MCYGIQLLTYRGGGKREKRDRGRRRHRREEREEARREETTHSTEEGVAEKCPRTERSDTEMDTEGGGEAGTSQSQARHKKGQMTKNYLTDSDEEAIVDFVKDHEELYNKTSEHFKDKAMKECLWERFTSTSCLSKCARLSSNPKGLTSENSPKV